MGKEGERRGRKRQRKQRDFNQTFFGERWMTIIWNQLIPETVTTLAALDGHQAKSKMAFSWASSPASGSRGVGYNNIKGRGSGFGQKKPDTGLCISNTEIFIKLY